MREYYAAVSEAFGETVTGEGPPVSPCDVDYYTARQELVAVGVSGDGRIRLMVRGMRAWTVRVAAGTVRALSEQEFCAGAAEAARELIRDQFDKIRELKQRCYR